MGFLIPLRPESTVAWHDAATGDWEKDCAYGRRKAEATIQMLRAADGADDAHFLRMMRELVDRRQFTGVEAGFFQRLLELAVSGTDAKR